MGNNPFEDLIKAQRDLEYRLGITEPKETPIYTKSSYTPQYLGTSTAGTTTYTTQAGAYIILGTLIVVYGRIVWTAVTGTGSGKIVLPFAARNTTSLRPTATIWINNFTFGGSWAEALLPEGSTDLLLYTTTSNVGVSALAIEAAGDVAFNISYFL